MWFNAFDTLTESSFKQFTVALGEDSLEYTFRVPTKEVLQSLGYEPDMALYINRVGISKRVVQSGGYWAENNEESPALVYNGISDVGYTYTPPAIHQPKYHHGGSSTYIDTDIQYVIWDYRAERMVACGDLSSSVSVFVAARSRTLQSLYGIALRNIINYSPFASMTSSYSKESVE